jgi:predicted PurR-regulated permease PerM
VSNPLPMARARAAWWLVGLVLGAALVLVVWSFIGTFVFGVFIYYATRPVYRRLKGRVRPPSLAASLALLTLALPVILLFSYTVAVSLQEVGALLERVGSEGPIADVLAPYIDVSSVVQNPQQILESDSLRSLIETSATQALDYLGFIGNGALHVFVMIAIAFYLLRDDHRLSEWFHRRFADGDGLVLAYAKAVDRDFSNIFFGNILNAFLTGIIGAVSYNVLDYLAPADLILPYPTLLGLLAGAASLIPVIGMKLVYVPMAAYLFYDAWSVEPDLLWFPAAFVVVSFVIVDTIPDFVLRPYVSGRGLHIGMVMFAYILGPLLFGWPGIFLGPVLLVLIVHFVKLVLPELVAGVEFEPEPVGDRVRTDAGGHVEAPSDGGPEDDPEGEAADEDTRS